MRERRDRRERLERLPPMGTLDDTLDGTLGGTLDVAANPDTGDAPDTESSLGSSFLSLPNKPENGLENAPPLRCRRVCGIYYTMRKKLMFLKDTSFWLN